MNGGGGAQPITGYLTLISANYSRYGHRYIGKGGARERERQSDEGKKIRWKRKRDR